MANTSSGVAHLTCKSCDTQITVRRNGHSFICPECQGLYQAIRCKKCRRAYLTAAPAYSNTKCSMCGCVEKMRYSTDARFDEVKGLLTAEQSTSRSDSSVKKAPGKKAPAQTNPAKKSAAGGRVFERLERRKWPIGISVLFVALGLLYIFRWGSDVQHIPSLWIEPSDLTLTFRAAAALAHGHLSSIYQPGLAGTFVEYPGMAIALAPLGALSNVFHGSAVAIMANHELLAHPSVSPIYPGSQLAEFGTSPKGVTYIYHDQAFVALDIAATVLSCLALFACDALTQRLQVSQPRRIVVCAAVAVLLWNVTVLFGHPEDAVAVAFAVYALVFALNGRFAGAGWLFGVALLFQPLVLLMLPVLLAMAGRRYVLGMTSRSLLPAAAAVILVFAANVRATFRALIDQPTSPSVNHSTPWTALSPHLAGGLVAAGPVRILGLIFAIGLGVWVYRRWLGRPELLAWSCSLALALRVYTESVMTSYYASTAMMVGVAVAARCSARRFGIAIVLALSTTIVAEWKLAWLPWWAIQVVGLTALLAVAYAPAPLQRAGAISAPNPNRVRAGGVQQNRNSGSSEQRKGAVTKQSVSRPPKACPPAQAQSSSAAIRAMEKATKNEKARSKTAEGTGKSPDAKASPKRRGPSTDD